MSAKIGTPVYAVANGVVISTYEVGGTGKAVYINHTVNGKKYTSVYMHLSRYNVKFNDVVIESLIGENALDYAEEAIQSGVTAFAGFGRMTFAYPEFYTDYLKNGKLDKSKVCLKCSKCTELMRNASVAGCPVRDSETYMPYYRRDVLKK